jgi:transposase-like protein
MGIFAKNKNPGAYRGSLNCPGCRSTAIRKIEDMGPYRIRYRCRKCGLPFQYDFSAMIGAHPYAPYKGIKWQRIVERSLSKGRT